MGVWLSWFWVRERFSPPRWSPSLAGYLGLAPAAAAILGAALASTDPIMLRGLIRRPGLAEPVRLALRLESGLNDAVLLPIIFVAMPFLFHRGPPSGTRMGAHRS